MCNTAVDAISQRRGGYTSAKCNKLTSYGLVLPLRALVKCVIAHSAQAELTRPEYFVPLFGWRNPCQYRYFVLIQFNRFHILFYILVLLRQYYVFLVK